MRGLKIDGSLEIKSAMQIIRERGIERNGPVQKAVDSEVLRLCAPYVPHDSGDLIRSGQVHTHIGSGLVVYKTPYARRWYYRPARFKGAPKRGNYWFERMKNEGGKGKILRVAARIAKAEVKE